MEFFENELYHIYNRGNNKQKIFFTPENYLYFMKKVRIFLLSCCDILAYCLMPNHFIFFIHSDKRTIATKSIGSKENDYCGLRNGTLCNKELAIKLLDLNMKTFYKDSYKMIGIDGLKNIF
jgi:REP element-mobilizing transposase RayT